MDFPKLPRAAQTLGPRGPRPLPALQAAVVDLQSQNSERRVRKAKDAVQKFAEFKAWFFLVPAKRCFLPQYEVFSFEVEVAIRKVRSGQSKDLQAELESRVQGESFKCAVSASPAYFSENVDRQKQEPLFHQEEREVRKLAHQ